MPAKRNYAICPACRQVLQIRRIVQDSMEGRRWWSDGWLDDRYLPRLADYLQCPGCGAAFPAPARRLQISAAEAPPGVQKAINPDSGGYQWLLDNLAPADAKDEELNIRLAWWRHLNDGRREGHRRPRPALDSDWQQRFIANLAPLAELLAARKPLEVSTLGEVLRELGRFDEALAILTRAAERDRWAATLIANHAAAGNPELFGLVMTPAGWHPLPPPQPAPV